MILIMTLLHVLKEAEHKWLNTLVQVLESKLNEMRCVCPLYLEGCDEVS